ncbi:MAG: hypothetical protein QG635_1537, partial [Bacteroidota bacterium]|nr:hypothetical protein [Bacteroidota bacterium]
MKRLLRFTLSIIIFASVYSIIPNDCSAQGWEQLATLSNAPNIPAMAAANGKIYVMSGTGSGTAVTHEYDPATDTWSNKAPIPQSTFWSTASEVGGKIYVMGGGQAYPGKTYNYIYDPATDSWTKGADLLTGRMYHSAAVANGKIYLMGGQNGDGTSEWYFDEYDPAADSWQRKAQILHNSAWYSGAVGVGSKVYRIAGGGSNPTLTKDYFDEYDVVTDTWTALTPFPIKLHAPAAVNLNGNIVVAGGYTNSVSIDSIYLHSPGTEGWGQTFIRLPEPRTYHKAAVIGSYLYIYGGQGNDLDL